MKTHDFANITDFVLHLATVEVAVRVQTHNALEKAARLVERTAKAEIGHYQPEIGPFPAWADLAESTEAQKARMGYPAGAPLLATGDMQKNISYQIEGNEAVIGSPDDRAVFHEFGTSKMPPRPVLGPAVFSNQHQIQKILGAALLSGLLGGQVTEGGADYFLGH